MCRHGRLHPKHLPTLTTISSHRVLLDLQSRALSISAENCCFFLLFRCTSNCKTFFWNTFVVCRYTCSLALHVSPDQYHNFSHIVIGQLTARVVYFGRKSSISLFSRTTFVCRSCLHDRHRPSFTTTNSRQQTSRAVNFRRKRSILQRFPYISGCNN